MTPQERAAQIHVYGEVLGVGRGWHHDEDRLRKDIASAIEAAVLEEREAWEEYLRETSWGSYAH